MAQTGPTVPPVVERLARVVLDYVLAPPSGDDSVVNFADAGEIVELFESVLPLSLQAGVEPATADELVAALSLVIERSVQTSHPRFMNQNFAGPDPIAVVGDFAAAALNTTNATYEAAPVFTLMEHAALRRLAGLAGFEETEETPGLFCAGGSLATLLALQLARHRAIPAGVRFGFGGEPLVLFVSESGHYAAAKSASMLGLGSESAITIASDRFGAMVPAELELAIADAASRGDRPFAVVATAGTTVTSGFDPLNPIADICERYGLWLHVDGAWGASALFSPQHRHHLDGVHRADSLVWNLHKMMGATQQCTALLVARPEELAPCFATGADYLFQADKNNAALDAGDRTFQCGRRVDVLKLWLAWQAAGDAGFAARVDHAVALADHARDRVEESDRFELMAPGEFTNVCFVWVPPSLRPLHSIDAEGRRILRALAVRIKDRMQREGTMMLSYQEVDGVAAFRFIFMNPNVTTNDVDEILTLIASYGEQALADLASVEVQPGRRRTD